MLRVHLTSSRARHLAPAVIVLFAVGTASCNSSATGANPDIVSIRIDPTSLAMTTGAARALTAVALDAAGAPVNNPQVHWSSENPAVASVSAIGLVTAAQAGKTQVAASKGGISAVVPVTVSTLPPALVRVTPASSNILIGSSVQLTGEVLDTGGGLLRGYTITWKSNSVSIAAVNSNGVVTGVSQGNVVITGTAAGLSGTAIVSVSPAPVATVNVAPTAGSVQVGRTLQMTVNLLDAAGNVLSGRAVTWQSSNAKAATVSSTGLVLGIKRGTTTILTTSEGKTGSATITVP